MLGMRGRTTLFDRREERAALDRLLAGALARRSGVLVLRGEAGIGKSALLEHAVDTAPDFRVARVTGIESEMELAFAGLHQLWRPEMRDRLDRLPEPQRDALGSAFGLAAGTSQDLFLVGLAVLGLLADIAEERPLLCVVDDAQWLDRASVRSLAIAGRRLEAEGVVMLFAVREPCAALALEGLPELRVQGLADRDAQELLMSVVPAGVDARVRDRIVAETRGNPLALLELPRGLDPAELAGFGLPATRAVPDQVEESFTRRVERLPSATRLLLLVAAIDPTGEPQLVWAAAAGLGLGDDAAAPAEADGLVEFGPRIAFRHSLVRSAVYRAASEDERRTAHAALAGALDPGRDPERRAWHRAHATFGPDEEVAEEVERAAGRVLLRGCPAAAAALLEQAVVLTPDPRRRAARLLEAARVTLETGSARAATELIDAVDVGLLDELQLARIERMRARIAYITRRGRDAPPLLLRAARRLEALDVELARETYLEALEAAMFAGTLADEPGMLAVARAARAAPPGPQPPRPGDLLLDGLAALLTDGYATGVPMLRRALDAHLGDSDPRWLALAVRTATDLCDVDKALPVATRAVQLAREAGALTMLPIALARLAALMCFTGNLTAADALIEEATSITRALGNPTLPYATTMIAAWRGLEEQHAELVEELLHDAEDRGEGRAVIIVELSTAVLHNGLGNHHTALPAAERACATGDSPRWALMELVEAAARSGRPELAHTAVRQLDELARFSGTEFVLGLRATCLALLAADGGDAEGLFREALDRLGRTCARIHLARAHLLYGEWLRGQRRRLDAREQLRSAHGMFTSMGTGSFASRAARELAAAGERAPRPSARSGGPLTSQEAQIARLAYEGLTNPEIGARIYVSPRTVEYHLHKVFAKLGVNSRTELAQVLADLVADAATDGRRSA